MSSGDAQSPRAAVADTPAHSENPRWGEEQDEIVAESHDLAPLRHRHNEHDQLWSNSRSSGYSTGTAMDGTHSYRRSRQRSSTMKRMTAPGLPSSPKSKHGPWPAHRRSESDLGSRGRSLFLESLRYGAEEHDRSGPFPRSTFVAGPSMRSRASGGSDEAISTIMETTLTRQEPSPDQYASYPSSRPSEPGSSAQPSPPSIVEPNVLRHSDDDNSDVNEDDLEQRAVEAAESSTSRLSAPAITRGRTSRNSTLPHSGRKSPSSSPSMSSEASGSTSPDMAGEEQETDRSSSPARSAGEGYEPPRKRGPAGVEERYPRGRQQQRQHHTVKTEQKDNRYGTPEMPRGTASLPHLPPRALKPRPPSQPYAMHLPRAEKLPMSGYELLAACISGQEQERPDRGPGHHGEGGQWEGQQGYPTSSSPLGPHRHEHPPLKPIYRRFDALNHRVLLHLQDELSELEEQLHRLDTADTQTRRVQNQILPASRRAENLAGGELQLHKTEVLGKIGTKLGQYNQALTSFTETQRLANPSLDDVENYRNFLTTENLIAEMETRFLDSASDLITLAASPRNADARSQGGLGGDYHADNGPSSDDTTTPMAGQGAFPSPRSTTSSSQPHCRRATASGSNKEFAGGGNLPRRRQSKDLTADRAEAADAPHGTKPVAIAYRNETSHRGDFGKVVVGTGSGVLVPAVAFAFIPGFAGRVALVLLVVLLAAVAYGGLLMMRARGRLAAGDGRREGPRRASEVFGEVIGGAFSSKDLLLCFGTYCGVMTVIAGIVG